MAAVTLKIDNLTYQARLDETILQVALKNGLYIPHLCFHPDLPPTKNLLPSESIYRGAALTRNNGSQDVYQAGKQTDSAISPAVRPSP